MENSVEVVSDGVSTLGCFIIAFACVIGIGLIGFFIYSIYQSVISERDKKRVYDKDKHFELIHSLNNISDSLDYVRFSLDKLISLTNNTKGGDKKNEERKSNKK